jgi:hypothetical protein
MYLLVFVFKVPIYLCLKLNATASECEIVARCQVKKKKGRKSQEKKMETVVSGQRRQVLLMCQLACSGLYCCEIVNLNMIFF